MITELIVLADYANVTLDQRLNVLGVLNNIQALRFPATHPLIFLAAAFQASQKEQGHKVMMGIKLVNKNTGAPVLPPMSNELQVPKSPFGVPSRMQLCIGMNGVLFPEAGTYEFQVLVNGNLTATTPLYVHTLEPARSHSAN